MLLIEVERKMSAMAGKLAAVIPAYNEELAIGSVVLKTLEQVDRVIVVDDGSTDATAQIAKAAGAMVISLDKNQGKAWALMRGLREARERGFDFVVTLDGDGQHDPREIPNILAPLLSDEADLVIGSRFLGGGRASPRYRRMGQSILDKVTALGSRREITDSQSGFRALNRRALENLDFQSSDYSIESEMIIHFSSKGMRMKEVPISSNYDVPNKHKKHPLSHGLSVLNRIVGTVGYRRPLLLFGVPGLLLFLVGVVLGTASFFEITLFRWSWLVQTLAAIFFFTFGAVLGVSALILNSLAQLLTSKEGEGGQG